MQSATIIKRSLMMQFVDAAAYIVKKLDYLIEVAPDQWSEPQSRVTMHHPTHNQDTSVGREYVEGQSLLFRIRCQLVAKGDSGDLPCEQQQQGYRGAHRRRSIEAREVTLERSLDPHYFSRLVSRPVPGN